MFKVIPINSRYEINLNGEIRTTDGTACTLERQGNMIRINRGSQEFNVDIEWLALIAHYEVNLPPHLSKRIFDITFVDCDDQHLRLHSKKLMVFNRPMMAEPGYRVVPGFTDYAISRYGDVILSCNPDQRITVHKPKQGYPTIVGNNPDKTNTKTNILLHRLIALAWCKNDAPGIKTIVNHLNGNKSNCLNTNLEWTTQKDNLAHAVDTGLRVECIKCRVRDIEDGIVTDFPSVRQACEFMGITLSTKLAALKTRPITKLINERYEFRAANDTRPWVSTTCGSLKGGRYITTAKWVGGHTETFTSVVDIRERFGVNTGFNSIKEVVDKARELHPKVTFEVKDIHKGGTVEAKHIETGEVIEEPHTRKLAARLGVSRSGISSCLKRADNTVYKGYIFRYKSDLPWPTEYRYKANKPKCILATNSKGETIEFPSLRAIAKQLRVLRQNIKIRLDTDVTLSGWSFKTIT